MLFSKECKKILHSFTYILYCALVILMVVSQYFGESGGKVYPPVKGGDDYGYKIEEDHDIIMSSATVALTTEYFANRYVCYPFGFYKAVHLNNKEQAEVEKYISELSGLDSKELIDIKNNSNIYNYTDGTHYYSDYNVMDVPVSETLTYERFTEIMGDVDDILGGGSDYAVESLVVRFSRIPMTYEDAVEDYNELIEDDKITGAYARLFSDYAGIVLAIVPVFVAAALTAADRRRKMNELIYSRKTSSFRLVFTRYASLVTMMFIPVFLLIVIAFVQLLSMYSGEKMDMSVMFTLPTFWLLPNIMTASAIGMLVTELFSGGAAILVQFVWWFMGLMMAGTAGLDGMIGKYTFICRHNSLGMRRAFFMNWDNFVFNRIFYIIISLAAAVVAVLIYDMKRGGRFDGIRLFGKNSIFRRKA